MFEISKENSTIAKGIAISMMLFLHLFNGNHANLCTNLVFIGNIPLATWLTRACNPVSFFLLLSGYGLAYKYEKNKLSSLNQSRSVLFLYINYWIILTFFLVIGHLLKPARYPGDLDSVLLNYLGWHTTYNTEMWFLFPYSIISICSVYIIRIIDRIGILWSFLITACIHLATSYGISRYGVFLFNNMVLYQPLLFLHLLYSFTLGVIMKRLILNYRLTIPQWGIWIGIIISVCLMCIIDFDGCYMIYTPLMVILFCHIKYPKIIKKSLMELGKKSMPIWMIHTWLAYYLFQSYIYSLRYPLLIFIGLMAASYILSIPIIWIVQKINKRILLKR